MILRLSVIDIEDGNESNSSWDFSRSGCRFFILDLPFLEMLILRFCSGDIGMPLLGGVCPRPCWLPFKKSDNFCFTCLGQGLPRIVSACLRRDSGERIL